MRSRLPLLSLLLASAASAQTLPLPAGAGFEWERVGDRPSSVYHDLTFDAGGTLWDSDRIRWLNPATDVWVEPTLQNGDAILTLGPHPAGGPARADTIFFAGGVMRRSLDGGETWHDIADIGDEVMLEIPAGYPYAGRLLVGGEAGVSDDRGDTWQVADYGDAFEPFTIKAMLPLPPVAMLPGVASGLDPAAPSDWPAGRVVAVGNRGGIYSDDGGASYRVSGWYGSSFGRDGQQLVVVRRPDSHPLGPGPRLLMAAAVTGDPASSAWTSDDAGETWVKRQFLYEPLDGPGYGQTQGLFALPPEGTDDPGASGEAIALLGRGHIYRTLDAGDTWTVVGRVPEMSFPPPPGESPESTLLGAAEMGPDGRLYAGALRLGTAEGWIWRTVDRFVVADEAPPPSRAEFGVTVRPNPSAGGAVTVALRASPGVLRVEVLDAVGRSVVVLHDGAVGGALSLSVDTSRWAPGVYAVRVTGGGAIAAETFTVVR